MLRSSVLASAATALALTAASSADAATGHATTATGGTPLGATGALAPYTGPLFGQDGAGNVTFVTSLGTWTCTLGTFSGSIGDGGAPYPIGGTGPAGFLSGLALTNTGGAQCTSNIASWGNPTVQITLIDANGAAPGLADLQGDWNAGSPRYTVVTPTLDVKFSNAPSPCRYRGGAGFTLSVTNAPSQPSATATSQPLARVFGPALCPTSVLFSGVFGLSRSATLVQPLFLSA